MNEDSTVAPPTRVMCEVDAAALTHLVRRNRAFMAPHDPVRSEQFYTVEGQSQLVRELLDSCEAGRVLPHVILDVAGDVVGRITLSGIVRGALMSGSIGYWVSEDRNGRGLATRAVAHIRSIAFDGLGLHRLQAETLLDNWASQRVLERNGFVRFGLAPDYLHIGGRWRDHAMFQVLNPDVAPM